MSKDIQNIIMSYLPKYEVATWFPIDQLSSSQILNLSGGLEYLDDHPNNIYWPNIFKHPDAAWLIAKYHKRIEWNRVLSEVTPHKNKISVIKKYVRGLTFCPEWMLKDPESIIKTDTSAIVEILSSVIAP
jgi:hypothetical protein